ncbi:MULTISPECIES: hypothetical protein [Bradyrhizobium]|uniref:hypothetical protein n=1 Tax=Bradyrhizobium TaxID=374 RepID=UPI001BA950C6|nr:MULTISPECIES: hypothetical protein [Bradyrhizobium]MBR1166491.1 hypothetical protein [Bradyrhizobium liaoningense]UWU71209.1 hypothetical protein N2602_11930 [Bradyrhizobium sp. NC92]
MAAGLPALSAMNDLARKSMLSPLMDRHTASGVCSQSISAIADGAAWRWRPEIRFHSRNTLKSGSKAQSPRAIFCFPWGAEGA